MNKYHLFLYFTFFCEIINIPYPKTESNVTASSFPIEQRGQALWIIFFTSKREGEGKEI